jgi:hypothetical protein
VAPASDALSLSQRPQRRRRGCVFVALLTPMLASFRCCQFGESFAITLPVTRDGGRLSRVRVPAVEHVATVMMHLDSCTWLRSSNRPHRLVPTYVVIPLQAGCNRFISRSSRELRWSILPDRHHPIPSRLAALVAVAPTGLGLLNASLRSLQPVFLPLSPPPALSLLPA